MVFTTFLLQVYYPCKSSFSSSFSLNFSSQDLNEDEKSLLIKGPSFCPVPRDINRHKLLEDWEKFKNSLEVQFSSTIIIITMILNLLITVSLSFPPLRKSQAGRLPCPVSHSLNYFQNQSKPSYLTQQLFAPSQTILPLVRDRHYLDSNIWIGRLLRSKIKFPNLQFLIKRNIRQIYSDNKSQAINFEAIEPKKESLGYVQLTNSEFVDILLQRVELPTLSVIKIMSPSSKGSSLTTVTHRREKIV